MTRNLAGTGIPPGNGGVTFPSPNEWPVTVYAITAITRSPQAQITAADHGITLSPQVFGGNQYGYVFILNVTETDNGGHIDSIAQSKRWNPFVTTGERCRFGYIDVYYQINPDVTIQGDLFMNNSQSPNLTKFLTMDGPVDDDFAWKRIFVNMQGEFIRMRISTPIINPQTGDEDINNGTYLISGICLWASPAGRLTPGVYS